MQQGSHRAGQPEVLVVSHGYEPIYERGFCNGLSDNHLAYVLVSSDRTDYAGLRPGARTLNLRGSQDNKRAKWKKRVNLLRYHLSLLWHVAFTRPLTVHVMGLIWPPLFVGVLEALWYRAFARHYVLTVHDLLPHDHVTAADRLLFHWSFRLAQTLVVHTTKMRDALIEQHGIAPERIIVMEHGIEPIAATVRAPRRADDTWNILFFGKVMRYKGVDILLEALAELPVDARLVIAGVGVEPALTRELEAAMADHPRREHITWHNRFIEESELPGLFGTADVVVLPYRKIDQSGILFQALRYGVPLVATRVGTFEHYVSEDVGELAASIDSTAFREAMMRLNQRRAALTRDRVSGAGRRYEWQHTVKALAALYPPDEAEGVDEGAQVGGRALP